MTLLELRGQSCIPLVTKTPPPKSIQASRTWGNELESIEDVSGAMLEQVLKIGRQLRQEGLAAGTLSVFLRYGHRHYGTCGYFTEDTNFSKPVMSDIELAHALNRSIQKTFRQGFKYSQGGVTLCDFTSAGHYQLDLFDQELYERKMKLERFSNAVDAINEDLCERAVYPASLAIKEKIWRPNRQFLSEKWESLRK
jgi:DNA polymerase V